MGQDRSRVDGKKIKNYLQLKYNKCIMYFKTQDI